MNHLKLEGFINHNRWIYNTQVLAEIVHCNVYSTNRKALARDPTPLGTLGVLSYELRCMIYQSLFLEESTSLTQVSKTLAADTKASINRYYEFHVTLQWDSDHNTVCSDLGHRRIPTNLDHLTVHFILSPACEKVGGDRNLRYLLKQVVARAKPHMSCYLIIELPGIKEIKNQRWVYSLTPLRKFKAVNLGVESGVVRNRNVALELHHYHSASRYYHYMVGLIQNYVYYTDRPCQLTGHTIWYVSSDGWVKGLKDREEDERIDYRYPRLGTQFPGGVAYDHCSASDIVLVDAEDSAREILRARNGNHNGRSIRYDG